MIPTSAPLFVVMNAGSGRQQADAARAQIAEVLDSAGRTHEFLFVDRGASLAWVAQAAAWRARSAGGAVVAAGGDGTISGVAQAVMALDVPLGVIPQGTFNYFTRAHGIPQDTAGAARALLRASIEPRQVGVVNGRVFLVNASLGLYPQLLEDRERFKQQFGRSRGIALLSGLRTLLREHRQLHLSAEHDARVDALRTPTLFVGNNPLQLERLGFAEARDMQGRLAAIALEPASNWAMLGLVWRAVIGRLGEAQAVRSFAFHSMTVRTRRIRAVKVGIDGEIVHLRSPLHFRVAPQALRLLCPHPDDAVPPA